MGTITKKNYNQQKFDPIREQINKLIKNHEDKEKVLNGGNTEEGYFDTFLQVHNDSYNWDIDKEDWFYLVEEEWTAYVEAEPIIVTGTSGVIFGRNEGNKLEPSESRGSSWQRFKKQILKEKLNFPDDSINNIENDNKRLLKNLNLNTESTKPNKGLVIGSVQSGKTTNMAALMAMASDNGFNVFIILSGMIETLRLQTENRLQGLLEPTSKNRTWRIINRPRLSRHENPLSTIFDKSNNYYMVVLKQVTRLKDLINWLQADPNLAKDLKILVIDDESDQASANTSKEPEYNRKTINRLIVNLIHNKDVDDNYNEYSYGAMNYIGYTATPYANILSESPNSFESLYPKDFIAVLSTVKEHFGPKEIFGLLGEDDDGINIIREIKEPKETIDLLNGLRNDIPYDLKEAIAYFVGAAASLRLHEFKKPVSMLVHISNKIADHDKISAEIKNWLLNKDEVMNITEIVWERERKSLNIEDIREKVYINKNKSLKPHTFDQIREEVNNIISDIRPITINDRTNKLIYHNGIHTIVDHSQPRGSFDEEYRLNYPSFDEDLEKTPAFLVVGGATLSRGMTLEGLVSTYFLRTPSSADTLTQMGRWFGFRIGYELYPRIWLTNKTLSQFKYISTLEEELREEIKSMSNLGQDFSLVGPKIKHSPQYINLTSRNKSYDMRAAEYDFSGYSTQTYIFDNNVQIQKQNVDIGEKFINSLGMPNIISENSIDKVYWEDVAFKKIKKKLLNKFKFNERIKALNNIDVLIEWIEKATKEKKLDNWNVILGGIGRANHPNNNWHLKEFTYNKVIRTRKQTIDKSDINIGVLRAPSDLYADIDLSKIKDNSLFNLIRDLNRSNLRSNYNKIRTQLGLDKTPQLILYKIDKDSKPRKDATKREELGIDSDIIGIYISIPGTIINKSNTIYVTVDINDVKIKELDEIDYLKGDQN